MTSSNWMVLFSLLLSDYASGQLDNSVEFKTEFGSVARETKRCYVCSGKFPDRECELYPEYVTKGPGKIECTRNFCTTYVRYRPKKHLMTFTAAGEFKGTIRPLAERDFEIDSIARECENLERGNKCSMDHDGLGITCYTTCVTDLCNVKLQRPTNEDISTPLVTSPSPTTSIFRTLRTSIGDEIHNNMVADEPMLIDANVTGIRPADHDMDLDRVKTDQKDRKQHVSENSNANMKDIKAHREAKNNSGNKGQKKASTETLTNSGGTPGSTSLSVVTLVCFSLIVLNFRSY